VGCAPYGIENIPKWHKTVKAMGEQCDLMIHLGDVMAAGPHGEIECNRSFMEAPIVEMMQQGKPVLFTPADNEVADCHRAASVSEPYPVDFLRAEDARNFFIDRFFQDTTTDLTGTLALTTQSAACPFNTYVEMRGAAVSTYEVSGSQWYLSDESGRYPHQNDVDPIADRKVMYDRAKDCALSWLDQSFRKAAASGLKNLFLFYHAGFWQNSGSFPKTYGESLSTHGFGGSVWNETTLGHTPFEPLANKLLALADEYPNLMIYNVVSDWHMFHVQNPQRKKNLLVVMTEGDRVGLETFVKFQIDETVTVQEVKVEA